jgi:hypothetical protein
MELETWFNFTQLNSWIKLLTLSHLLERTFSQYFRSNLSLLFATQPSKGIFDSFPVSSYPLLCKYFYFLLFALIIHTTTSFLFFFHLFLSICIILIQFSIVSFIPTIFFQNSLPSVNCFLHNTTSYLNKHSCFFYFLFFLLPLSFH